MSPTIRVGACQGLMLSEIVFLLFILGVLGAIVLSVSLQSGKAGDRSKSASSAAAHQAKYLRYLAYVPERSEHAASPLGKGATPEARQAARPPAAEAGDASGAGDAMIVAGEETAALGLPQTASRAMGTGAGSTSASSARAADGGEDAISRFVTSAQRSSETLVGSESHLDVVIVNPTGAPGALPAHAAGGSDSVTGAFLVGGGQTQANPRAGGAVPAPGGSGTLMLIGAPAPVHGRPAAGPAAVPAPNAPAVVAGRRRGGSPRRVEFMNRGPDAWRHWPDVNRRRLTGTQGLETLSRALDLLQDSDAFPIAEDLVRKGIAISFGDPSEFAGEHQPAAEFIYPSSRPPGAPEPPPTLRINPKFLHEDPRVLAAVLAHEGTHFQQYLEGTLRRDASVTELEARAWMNSAVVWQQVRRSALPLQTPLVRDLEVGYQIARQGEGPLRDFMASLYTR